MDISSGELKLAVGESEFTCCETNHLGHDFRSVVVRMLREIVLDRMIEAKANHLFMLNNVVYGRWTRVLKHWWLRGLDESNWNTKHVLPILKH